MRSMARPKYRTAKIAPKSLRLDANTACAGLMRIRVRTVGIQVGEQEQVQQAAEVNDAQQYGLQGVSLAEQHLDCIAAREIDPTPFRWSNVEALGRCGMGWRQIIPGNKEAR